MSKNSTQNINGRYVLGGLTEVSLSSIKWWNKKEMSRDPSDIIYAMEKKYEGRPDLLGYVFYGDPAAWWIIAQFNGILDPYDELVEGKILIIPKYDRIKRDLKSQKTAVGGIPSTQIK